MTICILFASCDRCSKPTQDIFTGYNYDKVVQSDYDYISSQYDDFHFYEVDVLYKDILSSDCIPEIISIKTVFQCNDTCIMFIHSSGQDDTTYTQGWYLECMDMTAYNAVNYDSCMRIIEPFRSELNTRALTFRRILAPPFPKNGQYIFGTGILVVDGVTGEIERWNNINISYISNTKDTIFDTLK